MSKTSSPDTGNFSPRSGILRAALTANAGFSAASGTLMLLWPDMVGRWLGIDTAWPLQLTGAVLLLFAADLIHQATRSRMASWRALLSSLADFGWVGGTALILLVFPAMFSQQGTTICIAVAGMVLLFGVFQLIGMDRLHRSPDGKLHRHCILVAVNSSADSMWAIIGRIDEIARYMPSLEFSTIRYDITPTVGCVRECGDRSGKRWAEQCTAFDPESRRFDVEFLCNEPGFPFPASEMRGGWQVLPLDASSCEVMVWWELDPNPRWLAPVLLPLLSFRADRDFPRVVRNMAAEGNALHTKTSTHLIPRFC